MLSPWHGTDTEELLRNADIAMYAAKELKAGAVVFEPDQHVDHPVAADSARRPAPGAGRRRRALPQLPAEVHPRRRADRGRRGAAALAAPDRGAHPARRLHPGRRGHRHHPAADRAGAGHGAGPDAPMAGRRARRPRRGEPVHALPAGRAACPTWSRDCSPSTGCPPSCCASRSPRAPSMGDAARVHGGPAAAARPRRPAVHRRLRHRLQLDGLPAPAARRRAEDRPLVRARA